MFRDQDQNKNPQLNDDNFSDISDEIILKEEDGDFKLFFQGNLKDFNFKTLRKKEESQNQLLDTGLEEKVLAPLPPTAWNKNSNFYFDISDEDEIDKERKKIEKIKPTEVKKYSAYKISEKLIQKYKINLVPQLENSFFKIIVSYLKGLREKINTIESFKKLVKKADLKLNDQEIKELVNTLQEIKEKIELAGGFVLEDAPDLLEKREDLKEKNNKQNTIDKFSNLDPRQKIEVQKPEFRSPLIKRNNLDNYKKKVSDIKFKEKTISPIQELSQINIGTFRKLSDNPIEAAQKIINKIDSFEGESNLRKAEAIKNWRQSDLYKTYIDLGRKSMESGKSIEKIIEEKVLANEKTLNLEEFQVISDLNKKIKF